MEEATGKGYYKGIALKTLAFLLAFLLLAIAVFSLFFPKVCSDLTYSLGMKKLSASYAAAVYNKSQDINDLNGVFERSVSANAYKMTEKYGKLFVEDKYFDEYCAFVDSRLVIKGYKSYVTGNTAVAVYKVEGADEAIAFAKSTITVYEDSNAFDFLIVSASENGDKTMLQRIQTELNAYLNAATASSDAEVTAEMNSINADLLTVATAISKAA